MAHVLETKLKLDTTDFVLKSKQATTEAKKVGAAGDTAGKDTAGALAKASGAMNNLGSNAATAAMGMVASFASVGVAVGAVTKLINAALDKATQLGKMRQDFFPQLASAISGAGDQANAKMLEKFIGGTMPKAGVNRNAALALYESTRGALPTSKIGDITSLMNAATPIVKGMDQSKPESIGQIGMLMGELKKTFPGASPEEIAQRAESFREAAGGSFSRVKRRGLTSMREMMQTGVSGDDAQELLLASLYANKTTEASELLSDQIGLSKTGKEIRGIKQSGVRRFYRASGAERLQMLKNDPQLVRSVFGTQANPIINALKAQSEFAGKTQVDPSKAVNALNQAPGIRTSLAKQGYDASLGGQEISSQLGRDMQSLDTGMSAVSDWMGTDFFTNAWSPIVKGIAAATSLGTSAANAAGARTLPQIGVSIGQYFNATPSRTADTTTTRPAGGGSSGGAGGDGGW